ncbi:DoxX family membrane protein [Lacinutrix undariae]
MKNGNLLIRIGFGILFIWGGLEKFIEGFLGGVGLQYMADFFKSTPMAFLGDSGTYILAVVLATLELVAGVLLLANKKLFETYIFLAFTMFMALVLAQIKPGNWMMIMIHIALVFSLTGLALQNKK